MQSLNRVYLIGHLGQQPELRTSRSGRPFTFLSLATNRRWKDESEQWQERTDWHSVTVWGRDAELCTKHLDKGHPVFVEASLRTYIPADSDQNSEPKRPQLRLTADRVRFFSSSNKAESFESLDN